ncbi:hypothetical protein [Nocardia sp. CA-120079]|uniref:hypothetical protein n=1 Tax=Nocardia sp. CA-120079 TaxID=3239974 RepID=UPI003D96DDCA
MSRRPVAAQSPPEKSTIEAILVGMLEVRITDLTAGNVLHFWGLAAKDKHTTHEQIHTPIDPAEPSEKSPVLEHAGRFSEKFPHLWGYGFAWLGWVEAFASPADVAPEAKIAARLGRLHERTTAEQVVGATIYDAQGVAHTAYMHLHAPELGVSHQRFETRAHTADLVADFREGALAAHTWAAALRLDPVANSAVLEHLRLRKLEGLLAR